ncbi:MAG TPA: hypothetical protein VJ624_07820 [Thermodesulfobacteriota bacterium]|jgi:hypothetical protein|nr:hypothetical protein [Thermodesulfobacteriota bacterium]
MKKLIVVLIAVLFLFSSSAFAGRGSGPKGPRGPAPNSGDCIPDGSGFEGPNDQGFGRGPAPNSGDGIPDGSGFEGPNGPSFGRGPAPNSGDGIPDGSGF